MSDSKLLDVNNQELDIGDKVRLYSQRGTVECHNGALGIVIPDGIDWSHLEQRIKIETGNDNTPLFCMNDVFISFWELAWNYNCDNDCYPMVTKLNSGKG